MTDLFDLPANYADEDYPWICPRCSGKPLWNDTYIGQHILLVTRSDSRLYPVKIVKRRGNMVDLEWHPGNVYARGENPRGNLQRTTQLCVRLHAGAARPTGNGRNQNNNIMREILWPVRLSEDSAERHGYVNEPITLALESAASAVLDALLGLQPAGGKHLVMVMFGQWMGELPPDDPDPEPDSTDAGPKAMEVPRPEFVPKKLRGMARMHRASDFHTKHRVPILPGDRSLCFNILYCIRVHLGMSLDSLDDLLIPAETMLHLVILRTYLNRTPSDDDQIATLFKKGHFRRILTIHEQALIACHAYDEHDTTDPSIVPQFSGPGACATRPKHTKELDISSAFPLITIEPPHIWEASDSTGLSGGRPYAELSRKNSLAGPPAGPRPKPKMKRRRRPSPVENNEVNPAPVSVIDEQAQPAADDANPAVRRSKRLRSNAAGASLK
ncbi:hypothetical protein PLICRDRAFT_421890 [Plicaturopsis crispa FD-325 SS-3]|nr:hypothetical protein PLICRDRAFT_421890 [Plicaturopsis crispa FD-325 SS-3]